MQISRGSGTGVLTVPGCVPHRFNISVSSSGEIDGGRSYINCAFLVNLRPGDHDINGRFRSDVTRVSFRGATNTFFIDLYRDTAAVTKYDGTYKGDANVGGTGGSANRLVAELVVRNGSGSGTLSSPGCTPSPLAIAISADADISGQSDFSCILGGTSQITGRLTITGRADGKMLSLLFTSERGGVLRLSLPQQGEGAAPRTSAVTKFDGAYVGMASATGSTITSAARARLRLQQGRGSVIIQAPTCSSEFPVSVSEAGEATGQGTLNCTFSPMGGSSAMVTAGPYSIDGRMEAYDLRLTFRGTQGSFTATLRPEGAAPPHPFDGLYEGIFLNRGVGSAPVSLRLVDGVGETTWSLPLNNCSGAGQFSFKVAVAEDGKAKGILRFPERSSCLPQTVEISGTAEKGSLRMSFIMHGISNSQGDLELKRR
jgi:hypothetical protein